MIEKQTHLSSQTIDLLMLSALSVEESAAALAHADACFVCKQRLDETRAEGAHFTQFVFPRTLESVQQRASTKKMGFVQRLFQFKPLWVLATACLVVVVGLGYLREEDKPYLGVKSASPWAEVVVQRPGANQFILKSNSILRPKDRLQFVVFPSTYSHLMVVSKDGSGRWTVYFPFGQPQSAPLASHDRHPLPTAIELDDVVGRETLVLVFSKSALSQQYITQAIENGTIDKLPGVKTQIFDFEKMSP